MSGSRLEDLPALLIAAVFGLLGGLAAGSGTLDPGLAMLAPGPLTVAVALAAGRPGLQSVIAAGMSCTMAAMIAVPVLLLDALGGFLGGFW